MASPSELLDAAVIAIEHTALKGDHALLQAQLQTQKQRLERLIEAAEKQAAEARLWRERREDAEKQMAERLHRFQGVMIGVSLLASALFSMGLLWVSAEIASTRREHTSDVQQIRQSLFEDRHLGGSPP